MGMLSVPVGGIIKSAKPAAVSWRRMVEPLERRTLLSAYSITDLGTLIPGGSSIAQGINDKGQVVGAATVGPDQLHAFLYDGTLHDLGTLGGNNSGAYRINVNGEVVGFAEVPGATPGDGQHAFAYLNGKMVDLGVLPGASASVAEDVNSSGTIVGYSSDLSGNQHAVALAGGQAFDLNSRLPGSPNVALGVNDAGQAVGYYEDASESTHSFLINPSPDNRVFTLAAELEAEAINNEGFIAGSIVSASGAVHATIENGPGAVTDLQTLAGVDSSDAHDLNDQNVVVGSMMLTSGEQRAFIAQNGMMADLNGLLPSGSGWVLTDARGINNAGQVVGVGSQF